MICNECPFLSCVTYAEFVVCVPILLEQQGLNPTRKGLNLLWALGLIPLTCQNLVSILFQGIHCCVSPQHNLEFKCTCCENIGRCYFTECNAFQNTMFFDAWLLENPALKIKAKSTKQYISLSTDHLGILLAAHRKALISRDTYCTHVWLQQWVHCSPENCHGQTISSFQWRGLQTPRCQEGNLLELWEPWPWVLVCRLTATTPISLLGWIYQPVAPGRKIPAPQETIFHVPNPVLQALQP